MRKSGHTAGGLRGQNRRRRFIAGGIVLLGLAFCIPLIGHLNRVDDGYEALRQTGAPAAGRVLDRQGRIVAANQLNWRGLLVAEQTADVGATLETFGRIVPLTEQERARIEREVRRRRRFVPVVVREFLTWEEMARIELNAPDLPGISVDVGTTRQYPEGEHLAHVVGYVAPPADDGLLVEILGGGSPTARPDYADLATSLYEGGWHHLCLQVDSIDETLAALRRRGVTVVAEPFELAAIGRRLAFIADPWGNLIELAQVIGLDGND